MLVRALLYFLKKCQKIKMNRAKAVRNELPKVEFEERRTGYKALKYNGYTYVRATTKANQDGSIMWRCQHSRDQFKCKATCTSIGDTLTRESNVHSCPILTTMDIVYKQAERDILKFARLYNSSSNP